MDCGCEEVVVSKAEREHRKHFEVGSGSCLPCERVFAIFAFLRDLGYLRRCVGVEVL